MNYACPIPECGFAAHDSLSLEGHMENIHGAPRRTPPTVERNEFNKDWFDEGRAAGFSDEQLTFLERWHTPPTELDDLL